MLARLALPRSRAGSGRRIGPTFQESERAHRAGERSRWITRGSEALQTFIDAELRRRYADLLLSARIAGRRVLFYVLVEHKRDVEALAIVQVGRYMRRVWDKVLGDAPGLVKLPAIVPVLLLKTTAERRQEKVIMDVLDELRQEGRVEGRAQILLKQLTARFGPVPAEAKAQILAAKQPSLDRWALRVLTAPSLDAVLGAAKARPTKTAPARKTTRAARA